MRGKQAELLECWGVRDDIISLAILLVAAGIVVVAREGWPALRSLLASWLGKAQSLWAERPEPREILQHPSLYLAACLTLTMLVGWWGVVLYR